jgi:hypothetical protein
MARSCSAGLPSPPPEVKPNHGTPPTNSASSRPMLSLLIAAAASRHLGMRASSSARDTVRLTSRTVAARLGRGARDPPLRARFWAWLEVADRARDWSFCA